MVRQVLPVQRRPPVLLAAAGPVRLRRAARDLAHRRLELRLAVQHRQRELRQRRVAADEGAAVVCR